jgi:hypothetical protein
MLDSEVRRRGRRGRRSRRVLGGFRRFRESFQGSIRR